MADSWVSRGLVGACLGAVGVCMVSIWREPPPRPVRAAPSAEPELPPIADPPSAFQLPELGRREALRGQVDDPPPAASGASSRVQQAERMAVLLREQAIKIERELARAKKRGEPEDDRQLRVLKRLKERAAEVDERANAFRAADRAAVDGG